jgi:hypothetical protein
LHHLLELAPRVDEHVRRHEQHPGSHGDTPAPEWRLTLLEDNDQVEVAPDAPIAPRVGTETAHREKTLAPRRELESPCCKCGFNPVSSRPCEHGRTQGSHRHVVSPLRSGTVRSGGMALPPDARWDTGSGHRNCPEPLIDR